MKLAPSVALAFCLILVACNRSSGEDATAEDSPPVDATLTTKPHYDFPTATPDVGPPMATMTASATPERSTPVAIEVGGPTPTTPLASWGNWEIYVMAADGSNQRSLAPSPAGDSWPTWTPSGQVSFMSDRDGQNALYSVNVDGSNLHALPVEPTLYTSRHDWSPDGSRVVITSQQDGLNQIYVVDAGGNGEQRLTAIAEGVSDPAWSPDGTRIAFLTRKDGAPSIYIMNADGSDPRRLTGEPGDHDYGPAWSPDGTQLAFSRFTDSEGGHIVIINADGTGLRRLTYGGQGDSQPAWSPDGSRIAFVRAGNIWLIHVDGTGLQQLTVDPRFDESPQWSPDSSMIAFVSDRDGGQPVACSYVRTSDHIWITSLDQLAWTSHEIVAGTVIEELPAAFGALLDSALDQTPPIYTDYIVEVETWIRGSQAGTVRVRKRGGSVGACHQEEENAPQLAVGDRALLFLSPDEGNPSLPDAWAIRGEFQGYWPLDAQGAAQPASFPGYQGRSLDDLTATILDILAEPVASYPNKVPLDVSPAVQ